MRRFVIMTFVYRHNIKTMTSYKGKRVTTCAVTKLMACEDTIQGTSLPFLDTVGWATTRACKPHKKFTFRTLGDLTRPGITHGN